MRNLTLRQLRTLAAVAREGRAAAAAAALGLTPPAVTIQIRQLEEELGASLFDRRPDGFHPTAAGRLALETAARVFDALAYLRASLDDLAEPGSGEAAIGVVSTAKYFAPRLVAGFQKAAPRVRIALKIGNRQEIMAALDDYAIDFAIMGQPPEGARLEAAAFGDHALIIIAPPGHRLEGERDIQVAALAGETFLVREPGSGTRTAMERVLGKDFVSAAPGLEFGSNETIKQAVMAGLGIAFISSHTVAHEVGAGRIIVLDVEGLPIRRQWFVARRAGRALSPAAAAFYGFVEGQGARYLPDFPLLNR